jgi:protein phosphatase
MENLRHTLELTPRPDALRVFDWRDRGSRLVLDTASVTHPGRRRLNQDQHLVADLASARQNHAESEQRAGDAGEMLLAVADGMGGHPGGEVASVLAVRVLVKELLETPADVGEPLGRLERALRSSDAALHHAGARRTDLATMGTTLTAAWWIAPMLYFAHVGDSRLYLLRDGRLSRLTRDHTLAAKLCAAGHECSNTSGIGHILTQAVGGGEKGIEPLIGAERLEPGDSLLLCSDGLVRGVTDAEIERALQRADSARDATSALLAAALGSDDGDNITAVVARVLSPPRRGAVRA